MDAGKPSLPWPWDVPKLSPAKVSKIKAMAAQHPEAIKILIEDICGANRLSFTHGGEDGRRATDFAEGKRFVAGTLRNTIAAELPSPTKAPPPDLPNSPTPKAEAP